MTTMSGSFEMDCPCGNPEGTNKECERCRLLKRIENLETALKRIAEVVCSDDAEWIDTVLDGSAFDD